MHFYFIQEPRTWVGFAELWYVDIPKYWVRPKVFECHHFYRRHISFEMSFTYQKRVHECKYHQKGMEHVAHVSSGQHTNGQQVAHHTGNSNLKQDS